MKHVQEKALERALQILDVLKFKYAIEIAEGEYIGDLIVQPPSPAPRKKRKKKHEFVKEYDYVNAVKNAEVGDVLSYEIPKAAAESFQGSLSAAGCRHRGPGSVTTSILRDPDKKTAVVEALVMK